MERGRKTKEDWPWLLHWGSQGSSLVLFFLLPLLLLCFLEVLAVYHHFQDFGVVILLFFLLGSWGHVEHENEVTQFCTFFIWLTWFVRDLDDRIIFFFRNVFYIGKCYFVIFVKNITEIFWEFKLATFLPLFLSFFSIH